MQALDNYFCAKNHRQTDKFFNTIYGGNDDFFFQLNLLPPYLLRLQGDNLVSACLGIILCVIAKMKEKVFL